MISVFFAGCVFSSSRYLYTLSIMVRIPTGKERNYSKPGQLTALLTDQVQEKRF